MIRATARASLTGINRLDRSSTKPLPEKLVKLVILFVAVVIREGRIYHEAAGIVEALTAGAVAGNQPPRSGVGNQPPRTGVDVIALLVEVSEAVKRGSRAAGVVQAVEVCHQEGAVVPEVVAAGLVAAAVEAGDKDWVKMVNIINYKFDGGKSDAY
jgi:hypothetical protein